jgi:predicted phage terminase large subunit-like protein
MGNVIWKPMAGPQELLVTCPIEDVGYGGGKGGGKTDGLIGAWVHHQQTYGGKCHGLITRATYPELQEIIARCQDLFPKIGGKYSPDPKVNQWSFPNGSRLKLRYLETMADAIRYEGGEFTFQGFDEIGDAPSPAPYDRLRSRLRSKHGIPCVSRSTFNPKGIGHSWLKKRYVTPAPPFTPFKDVAKEVERVFIPSLLADNKILTENDPEYARRVRGSGTQSQVNAWLRGDWSDDDDGKHFETTQIKHLGLTAAEAIRRLGLRPLQFWDLATSEKQLFKDDPSHDPDFSACVTVARDELDRFILLHAWHGQVDASRLIGQMHALQKRFKCQVYGEKGAIANMVQGVMPLFNRYFGHDFAIRPVSKGNKDKVAHSIPLQMIINSGNFYVVSDCEEWYPALSEELRVFPNQGSLIHDDLVDGLNYAAENVKRQRAPDKIIRHASLPRDLTGAEAEKILAESQVEQRAIGERPWW